MKIEFIQSLHAQFEQAVQTESETGVEFWRARDLQKLLGYTQWRNFEPVIGKAITSCQNSGSDPTDHFARARKTVPLASGAGREVADWLLTRVGIMSRKPIHFAITLYNDSALISAKPSYLHHSMINTFSTSNSSHRSLRLRCVPGCCSCSTKIPTNLSLVFHY